MNELEQKQIFGEWLNQHKGIIFKIVRAYAFSPQDQEDLFQEVTFRLWQSVPDFRGESQPSTWIYRVALFAATSWLRQEKKRPEERSLDEHSLALTIKAPLVDDRLTWLYEQIGTLDPLDRSVCLLLLEGFAYREIARLLGLSESNVGVKIHRIKQHLQQRSREKIGHGV